MRKYLLVCFLALCCMMLLPVQFCFAQHLRVIRIGYLAKDTHDLACWVAREKGFFKKQGLEPIFTEYDDPVSEMNAFSREDIDIGYNSVTTAIIYVSSWAVDLKLIAQANQDGSSIVVNKDSHVKTLKDLEHQIIATPHIPSTQYLLLERALINEHLDIKNYHIVKMDPEKMLDALKQHQIAAFIGWEPYPARAIVGGYGKILLQASNIWENYPCCCVLVRAAFLQQHPEMVKAFVKAHVEAMDYINAYVDEAAKIAQKYSGLPAATIQLSMNDVIYDPVVNDMAILAYVNFLSRMKAVSIVNSDIFLANFMYQDIVKKNS